jgi:predicted  nucleic acid-binding Zn-ribbon protein
MQLRFLHVSGPEAKPTTVDFVPGLNVINGPSNTGKSYILGLINYMLGAQDPPEPIAEQALYDLAHLGIVMDDGTEKTLVRGLQGSDIKILDGLTKKRPESKEGVSVSGRHGAKASLSTILLTNLGAFGARMRVKAGELRDIRFTDLKFYALVDETRIQDRRSPVLTGQYQSKPVETSVFKYVLQGVDDSSMEVAKPDPSQPFRRAAQLELIDQQIMDLNQEIAAADQDPQELEQLESAIDDELAQTFEVQEAAESDYRDLTSRRRRLRREYEGAQDRIAEIDTLLARFSLLEQHYGSDRDRLEAIIEAGVLFALEAGEVCPICGAEPQDHRPSFACDGNTDEIVDAAKAEIAELQRRSAELKTTMENLTEERAELTANARELLPRIQSLQADILREVPSVRTVRSQTSKVIERKMVVQKSLELVRRRDKLISQRASLGVVPEDDSATVVASQTLDGVTLDAFCQVVEEELKSWEFPNAQRVSFEIPRMDIAISGKPRRANGKGVRALLHGAFSIGLMKFCRDRKRAHPGFVVLDSVFVTYRDPDGLEDAELKNSLLKDRAFAAFSELADKYQLIILDNVDVPDWLESRPSYIHFTGQPTQGRAGFFPPLKT